MTRYFIHPESDCCWEQSDNESFPENGLVMEVDRTDYDHFKAASQKPQTKGKFHMDSAFNPDTFLDQTTDQQGTSRPPISSGLSFMGIIGEPKARTNPGKKDPSKTYVFADIPITLDLSTQPTEVARVGQDKVVLRHSISIEYTSDGALDWSPGANRGLTAYREALDLNKPGTIFSPRMLIGRIVKCKIGHRNGTEIDPVTGALRVYDEISAVTKV